MNERSASWLPDFCRIPAIFVLMVATQVVVLAIAVAPGSTPDWTFSDLIRASAFGQWMALTTAVLLCLARPQLQSMPRVPGALLAWSIPVIVTATCAYLVWFIQVAILDEGSEPAANAANFVFRCATLAAMMSAVALRYFYVQGQWQRQVQQQAKAQVDALQARIRPHFLFNSMNTIASLIRTDPGLAERAVEDLSDLFRAALGADRTDSTLAEEIELAQRYLAIEELRLGSRLRQRWQLQSTLPMYLILPRLVLQPLLENAIVHGVAMLPEGGEVGVEITFGSRTLGFVVSNPVPSEKHVSKSANGHAQQSVLARLRYRFGSGVKMDSFVDETGYCCRVHIPIAKPPSVERLKWG